jgi:hypothetical protein
MRKSAAAAPAALEERELRGEDAGNGRDGSVSFGDHFRTFSALDIRVMYLSTFPGIDVGGRMTKTARDSARAHLRRRSGPEI